MNKEQKVLYNLPEATVEDWDKEYDGIYFFYVNHLHSSGYRYIVVVDQEKKKIIGYGDVLCLKVGEYTHIDCNKKGIFHLWNWNYKIKVSGCSTIDIKKGSPKKKGE